MEERQRPSEHEYRHYEDEIDLRDLLYVLWKQKTLIISIFVIAVAASAVISFMVLEPVYRASTIISLGSYNSNLYTSQGAVKEILTSDDFVVSVVNELDLDVPREQLRFFKETISVEEIKDTKFLRISVESTKPPEAQAIVDKIVELFIQKSLPDYTKHSSLIEEQLAAVQGRLSEVENEIGGTKDMLASIEGAPVSIVEKDLRRSRTLEYLRGNEEQRLVLMDRYLSLQREINSLQGVEVIRTVREPIHPVKPNKKLNVAVAGVLGLMVGVFLAFGVDYIRRNPLDFKEDNYKS